MLEGVLFKRCLSTLLCICVMTMSYASYNTISENHLVVDEVKSSSSHVGMSESLHYIPLMESILLKKNTLLWTNSSDTIAPRMMPTGDNIYSTCGGGTGGTDPTSGQGLFNTASLDVDNDGVPDQMDSTCTDVPYLTLDKEFVGVVDNLDGTFTLTYTISVVNVGGATGQYNVMDSPQYDDDISILNASFTATTTAGGTLDVTMLPWTLASDQSIAAGTTDIYTLQVQLSMDLEDGTSGDDTYMACGGAGGGDPVSGQGLFNEALLDVNDDGLADEQDTVCTDLPYLVMEKSLASMTQNTSGSYTVTYTIDVENIGGADGLYDLIDSPQFEDDIVILNASYTSTVGLAGTLNAIPYSLSDDVSISSGVVHSYTVVIELELDLTDGVVGDDTYNACGGGAGNNPSANNGLFNEALLDTNNDGNPEVLDTVCTDLPFLLLEKNHISNVQTSANCYTTTYEILVSNLGGADGMYDLNDEPAFDDDFTIMAISFTSDAVGNAGGTLPITNIIPLADDQGITPAKVDTYNIVFDVCIDLDD